MDGLLSVSRKWIYAMRAITGMWSNLRYHAWAFFGCHYNRSWEGEKLTGAKRFADFAWLVPPIAKERCRPHTEEY